MQNKAAFQGEKTLSLLCGKKSWVYLLKISRMKNSSIIQYQLKEFGSLYGAFENCIISFERQVELIIAFLFLRGVFIIRVAQ